MRDNFDYMLDDLLLTGNCSLGSISSFLQSSDVPDQLLSEAFIRVEGARSDQEKVMGIERLMAFIRGLLESRLTERMEQIQREFASDCYDEAYP